MPGVCWEPAPGEKQRAREAAFANCCGVNTPTQADFKLPGWAGKIHTRLTICGGQQKKVSDHLAGAEPLHQPLPVCNRYICLALEGSSWVIMLLWFWVGVGTL